MFFWFWKILKETRTKGLNYDSDLFIFWTKIGDFLIFKNLEPIIGGY